MFYAAIALERDAEGALASFAPLVVLPTLALYCGRGAMIIALCAAAAVFFGAACLSAPPERVSRRVWIHSHSRRR